MTALDFFTKAARKDGKRARTRARLMDAAVTLFAEQGFEAASVNEIAKRAEVANGTFYLHFQDKAEIGAAVAFAIAKQVVAELDAAMVEIDDAMVRTSLATRRFIDLASIHPDWGKAFFRAVWTFPELQADLGAYMRADLQRGARQGVFTVKVDRVLVETFAAMTLGALFARLEGRATADDACRVAEIQLLMLGAAPDLARDVAWRPAPPLVSSTLLA